MRIRTTIILVVISLGLFLYMYRVEIVGKRKKEEAKELTKKAMPYEADSVKVVSVRTGEGQVVAKRIEDGWEITEPVRTKGDKGEIDNLLENIVGISIERDLEESSSPLSSYGLAPAAVAVHMEGSGFSSDTLYVGEKNPTRTFVYARKSGSPKVFLLPQVTRSQLEKELFNLRDKKVLGVEREEVVKFTIDGIHGRITCEKRGEDWYLTEPIADEADQGSVSRVLSSVAAGKATGFAAETADDLGKFGLETPRATVSVFTGPDMVKHSLYVGEVEDKKVYAKDASRDPIFEMSRVFFESLDQDVSDFRNKRIMDFDRTQVTSIEVKTSEETIVCERDTASNWFVMRSPGPERVPAKKTEIDKLLSNLTTLRAEEFVDEKPANLSRYGLELPNLEVALSGEQGEIARVLLGGEKEDKVYARNNHKETVYLVRKRSADNLRVKYDALREEEEKKDEGGAPVE